MEPKPSSRTALAARLAGAGCIAPFQEVDELLQAAAGDGALLELLMQRRLGGEPLAWVTGAISFAGHQVCVHRGVYVPRRQSEPLVRRAITLLPEGGLAADLCTGSGAIALALGKARPRARVVASDIDPVACRCARQNGVEVYCGHLASPLPAQLTGAFDVVIAVVPYVPSGQICFLPRDVRDNEPLRALDGGPGGTVFLGQAVLAGAQLLRPGGSLLLELGGDQGEALEEVMTGAGYAQSLRHYDDDGDLRGIEAVLG